MQAAKLGAKVTIFEEHGKVGVPSHCTGHVSLGGLARLDLRLPEKQLENRIRAAVFYSPSNNRFSVRFPLPVTCVINRELFDKHLSRMAEKAGAQLVTGTRAVALLMEGKAVTGVSVSRGGRTQKATSKVVINCEGASPMLLRRAKLPSPNQRLVIQGVQAEVDDVAGIDAETVEVFLNRSFAPGFFAWIVPRRDRTAKIGLGTNEGNPVDHLRHFMKRNPIARERFRRSRLTSIRCHPISLGGPISKTFQEGLLVAGDAASHVKPTTGGGIVMGLTCARTAGEIAARAVCAGNYSASFLSAYEDQWKREIGFNMLVMRHLRLALNRFSNKHFDRLLAFCARAKLENDLKLIEDVDLQGTSLIRLVPRPKAWIAVLSSLLMSFL
jgi:geranylgeranyl reductase family protein